MSRWKEKRPHFTLKLVDALGQMHLVGLGKLRVQSAAQFFLHLLLVLVLSGAEKVDAYRVLSFYTSISGRYLAEYVAEFFDKVSVVGLRHERVQ